MFIVKIPASCITLLSNLHYGDHETNCQLVSKYDLWLDELYIEDVNASEVHIK